MINCIKKQVIFYFLFIWCTQAFASCGLYTLPTISVTSQSSDTICTAGTPSTFTATITGGGASPVYYWAVNGVHAGTNINTYTATLHNNDVVYCTLTSNLPCAIPEPVTSNQIRMTVDAGISGRITPLTDCLGNPLTVTGAPDAASIIWKNGNSAVDTAIAVPAYLNGIIRAGGNGAGAALNQLDQPQGVWVDSAGDVYVCDALNHRVLRYDHGSTSAINGVVVAGGNGNGSAANQLNIPKGVYIDKHGAMYVSDYGNSRVQKFPAGSTSATNGVTIAGGPGYSGSAVNDLLAPVAVQKDDSENIYILDEGLNAIMVFPPNCVPGSVAYYLGGTFFSNTLPTYSGMWVTGTGAIYASDRHVQDVLAFPPRYSMVGDVQTIVAGGNGTGNAANQLSQPAGIYMDAYGKLYVADAGNNRIQVFPPNSVQSTNGVTAVKNVNTLFIALDGQNNIYTSLTANGNVTEFINGSGIDTILVPQTPGTYTATISSTGGCRTYTTAAVTVLPNPASTVNGITCYNTPYVVGSFSHTLPGTYVDTLVNAAATGCDSIVTLHLQVDSNSFTQTNLYENDSSLTLYVYSLPREHYTWTLDGVTLQNDTTSTINIHLNGAYTVFATDSNGCNTSTSHISVSTMSVTSISNYNISLQPNPSNGCFTLNSQIPAGAHYIVYSAIGQQVTEGMITSSHQPVAVEGAAAGIYTLMVKDNGGSYATKFVITGR